MPKGISNARYTREFKRQVIEDIQNNKLSQNEASIKYEVPRSVIQRYAERKNTSDFGTKA